MADRLSTLYQELLSGSYDCVDRIVLNGYFRMGHDPGGFRVWRRALTGSDETLENTYLMRMAGRFSRRVRGYAKAHGIPVIDCPAGQRKHDLAEESLAKTTVTQGLFLVLVGRAQAPVWDVNAQHHIASQVGKITVGGIDLNKTRMRTVVEAVIALSPSPNGFTASDIAARVRERCPPYGPRHAAYDLKKLRGKQIVRRIGHTRRYEPLASGLRAITALIVLRTKAIKPLLAAARPLHPTRGEPNPKPIDAHYHALRLAMQGVFHELGIAA
jgi:hypothetical protein